MILSKSVRFFHFFLKIFIQLRTKLYQRFFVYILVQTVTLRPLFADLFMSCYERNYIFYISYENKAYIIDNDYFEQRVDNS